jgi:hypothetical protein
MRRPYGDPPTNCQLGCRRPKHLAPWRQLQSVDARIPPVTIVPWTVLEPGQTENIVGVLLGRELPRSVHLRPSRGDGGIDVLDTLEDGRSDVYQIKYFATALTDSRKEQIRQSVRRIVGNPQVSLRHWYLVVPLDPSEGEINWLRAYLKKQGIDGQWYGLKRLEGLAAAHQDVIDYYVGDGRRRVEESIEQLRGLAGLLPTHSDQLVRPADANEPLAALYAALNRDDPHFRYEFEVGEKPPPVRPLLSRPGLVASFTHSQEGVAVTHHIYGRFEAATAYRPVPLRFTVHANRMDETVAAEWARTVRYGTPVSLPTGTVTDLDIGLPGGLATTAAEAAMLISGSHQETSRPYRLRLQVIDSADSLLAETTLQMDPVTMGISGRGIRAHGRQTAGAFELEILSDIESDGALGRVQMSVTLAELSGRPPAALRTGLRFLSVFHAPNRLRFAAEYGPPADGPLDIGVDQPAVTTELVELIEALADLQERVLGDLRVPDLDALTDNNFREIIRAGHLVRGETITDTWRSRTFPAAFAEQFKAPPTGAVQLAISGRQEIAVGDQTVVLEPLTMVLLAAELSLEQTNDGQTITAKPALDNDQMLTRLASLEAVAPVPLAVDGAADDGPTSS